MELAPENPPSLTCSPQNEFVRSHPSHPCWLTRDKESRWGPSAQWWPPAPMWLALPRGREAGDDCEPGTLLWGLLAELATGWVCQPARFG